MNPKKVVEELRWIVEYLEQYNMDICQQKTIRNAVDLLEKLTWVPVKERLPDEKGHYLVISELNYWHGGCWDKNKDGTSRSIVVAFYDKTDTIGGKNYWNHSHVTHWMPLPDLPRIDTKS